MPAGERIIATSIQATGLVVACLLPLVLVGLLLWNRRCIDSQQDDAAATLLEYVHQDARGKNLDRQDVKIERLPEPK